MNKQRRQFTPAFKFEVVLEGLRGEKSIAQLCRERDITDSLYYSWRDQFLERAPSIFAEAGQQERSNAEQAARLLKELGGSRHIGRLRIQTTDSRHAHWRYPNLVKHKVITYPDEVWIADITYIRLGTRFLYLAVILDAYTRSVRGWALSRTVDQRLTLTALRSALANGRPALFHSDQGVQDAAWEHTALLRTAGCQISMAKVGQPDVSDVTPVGGSARDKLLRFIGESLTSQPCVH